MNSGLYLAYCLASGLLVGTVLPRFTNNPIIMLAAIFSLVIFNVFLVRRLL